VQEAATGRTLGAAVTRGAVHAAFLSLLWRLSALHEVERPDGRGVEALAAARSTFTGQLEAILDSTELVLTLTPILTPTLTPAVTQCSGTCISGIEPRAPSPRLCSYCASTTTADDCY